MAKKMIPCPHCNGAGKVPMSEATERHLGILADAASAKLKRVIVKEIRNAVSKIIGSPISFIPPIEKL